MWADCHCSMAVCTLLCVWCLHSCPVHQLHMQSYRFPAWALLFLELCLSSTALSSVQSV